MRELIRKVMSSEDLLLTYEEVLAHPIGEKIQISPGFETERLPTTKDVIFFRVELKKGVEIPIGLHNCFE